MQRFKTKKQSNINCILSPSVLASCLMSVFPLYAAADHLDLPSIQVSAERIYEPGILPINTSDTAKLLDDEPGISFYRAGGVSSLPVIHGLADDRIRIKVDGMDLISSCANHMNPPLSYIDPANVDEIKVFAGITPVSAGGDSIAGTIQVNSKAPEFAEAGKGLLVNGQVNTFYRSNNDARGVNLSASVANESVYMRYTGSSVEANNYKAGNAFKKAGLAAAGRGWLDADEVGSSAYKSINHALAFGVQHENHLLEFKLGLQNIPYQGFPNQRMDMTGNDSQQYNLSYKGKYEWGTLAARTYHERTRHSMQFGDDKQFMYMDAPGMPMETEGRTTGFTVQGDVNINARDILRVGAEYQRYRLDDWWPKSGSGMMMGPGTFNNINHGQRDRYDVFAEWDAQWNKQWWSQIGIRSSTLKMDAGNVMGYSNTNTISMGMGMPMPGYKPAADAFNASDRSDTDHNIDMTALARFTPDATQTYEAGYAIKNRSPNLYERYTWSNSNSMVMNMNNWVGDGNGYVGNLNLKPETAHTLSMTANWHDADNQNWQIKATPYITYVDDYIDAVACAKVGKTCVPRTDGFVNLSLDNQAARLYGIDVSARKLLTEGNGYGSFTATGILNYVRGKNTRTDDDLYNIMPLNLRLGLEHRLGGWKNSIQAKIVDAKDNVQGIRKELQTSGYTLFNLYSSYEWKQARFDVGVENIFDKHYQDPLGGAYIGQGMTMSSTSSAPLYGTQVPGMGRSINVGLTLKY